jgi:hypothetical protein
VVSLNPGDLGDDADDVVLRLNTVVAEAAGERGWRLEGPPVVTLNATTDVAEGAMAVETAIRPGSLDPWGSLIEARGPRRLHLTKNRSLVGRSRRADVMLGDDTVSRTHSLLWTDAGGMWIQDLASSNGTTINGSVVADTAELHDGDVVGFGAARFNFRRAQVS